MLFGMCFAPDGGRVLTACRDGQASRCDWQSGDLICPPGRHSTKICAVAFTPDGRWRLVGGRGPDLGIRTAQAWKFITGTPVTPSKSAPERRRDQDVAALTGAPTSGDPLRLKPRDQRDQTTARKT